MKIEKSLGLLWLLVVILCVTQVYWILGVPDAPAVAPQSTRFDSSDLEKRLARLEVALDRGERPLQSSEPARESIDAEGGRQKLDDLRALEQRVATLESRNAPRFERDPERRRALADLCEAIRNGEAAAARVLLSKVDINAADPSGNTPLILAASSGNVEMIEAVLARGASLEIRGTRGFTPLLAALECDHDGLADLLLDKGSNPRVRDKNGESALIWAAHAGSAKSVGRLLAAGLDVNAKSFDGNTAIADAGAQRTCRRHSPAL